MRHKQIIEGGIVFMSEETLKTQIFIQPLPMDAKPVARKILSLCLRGKLCIYITLYNVDENRLVVIGIE